MKTSAISRFLTILLAALLVVCFCACDNTPPKSTAKTGNTQGGNATTNAPPVSTEKPYLPDSYDDVKDKTYTIWTRDGESGYWAVMDLTANEILDEPINDAVYERNNYLTNKYGFTIEQVYSPDTNAKYPDQIEVIRTDVKSGTGAYDAVAINAAYTGATLSREGLLIDLNTVSTLDLKQDFWNQRYIESMSINNKLHTLVGDLSVSYWDVAWIQLFNKDLCEEKGIYDSVGDPYEFVNEGKWTLDVMAQMSAIAAEDVNGDGKMDRNADRFGYAYAPFNHYALFMAGGNVPLEKDADDLPVYSLYTTRAVETVEKIKATVFDTSVFTEGYGGPNVTLFNGGQALFVNAQMMGVRTDHRNAEFDFGVLPTPKIFDDQEEYTNIVSMSTSVWAIPISNDNPDEIGFVLNSLAYKSGDTLYPAYFDTTFSIVSRDEESEKALAKILKGAYFDLFLMYDFGGWMATFMSQMKTLDLASQNDKVSEKCESDIAELVSAYTG